MRASRSSLLALVLANAVSQLGNVAAVVALPWFVLLTTGSAARTGLTAFATTLPLALGAILGGPIVDRVGLRRASIAADLGAGASIAAIPLLHGLGVLEFWHVLALAFAAGAFEAPGRAARRAMLPDLAARASLSLERANSISTTSEHVGYVLGAPAAGLLIAAVGAPSTLLLDAASFAVSAGIVAVAVPSVAGAVGPNRLLDGFRFVLRTPLLFTLFAMWIVGGFLIGPLASVVLPVYARDVLGGAGSLAACVTAYGAGGLAGTVVYGVGGFRIPRRAFYVGMWTAYPAVSLALVAVPPLGPLLVLLFAIGFVVGAYDPFEATIHQQLIPPELRARVFAILLAVEMIVVPPSMLLNGLLMEHAGLRAALVLFGVGNALLGLVALVNRPARRLDVCAAATATSGR
ncbi:MAG: MFS transporter [Actinomycetota bacterium]|nr:MFS transporter [Actinomycetota bacterium]